MNHDEIAKGILSI